MKFFACILLVSSIVGLGAAALQFRTHSVQFSMMKETSIMDSIGTSLGAQKPYTLQ